jgi:hypothetical protein
MGEVTEVKPPSAAVVAEPGVTQVLVAVKSHRAAEGLVVESGHSPVTAVLLKLKRVLTAAAVLDYLGRVRVV